MTETQATSRPWVAKKAERSVGSPWEVYAKNPRDFICITSGNCKANAKLIVKAVNCHDELIKALKGLRKHLPSISALPKTETEIGQDTKFADEVLLKVESEA